MSASPSHESAYRPTRLQYLRETTAGTFVSNPTFNLYSDNIRSFEPEIDPGGESQRGLGSPDSQGVFNGTEVTSATVTYDLQQKTASGNTLHDGSGDPNDAITDAFERDSDNRIKNTHEVVHRKEQSSIKADNSISGSTSRDTRKYVVLMGAYPDEGTLTGDPNDAQPTLAEIAYECERGYTVQIDQPASSITLWVDSTNANDTTQNVDIESEDGSTSDQITLSGTTPVQTTESFADVDAIEVSAETQGDVRVFVDDGTGTSAGDQIARIPGQDSFDHGEGTLGVPILGSGSNASAIGQSYELYHDDEVERPDGTSVADGFETTEFSVANNVDGTNQGGTPRRALAAGDREVTVSVTVFGETEHHSYTLDMLTTQTDNVRWTMGGGHVQADTADPRSVSASESVGEAKMMTDVEFNGQGVTVSA